MCRKLQCYLRNSEFQYLANIAQGIFILQSFYVVTHQTFHECLCKVDIEKKEQCLHTLKRRRLPQE